MSGSSPISLLSCSLVPGVYVLLALNSISWCFILQDSGHFVNCIVLFFQLTFRLCLTSQSCPKNMSIPFKSITVASSCSLCPLISISRSATLVISPFFVPSTLNTLNKKLIGFIWILLSFTSYSLIPVCVHPELTNVLTLRFFPFFILIFAHMFNFFSELLYRL